MFRTQIEAELASAVVDAAIRGEGNILAEVGAWFKPEWLLDPMHRAVVTAVFELAKKKAPITPSMLAEAIHAGREHGGITEMASVIRSAYGWNHMRFLASRVYDEHRRTLAAEDAREVLTGMQGGGDVDVALKGLGELQSKLAPIELHRAEDNLRAFEEILSELDGQSSPRVKTGIAQLDELTTGFGPGNLIVVGANTSAGKSAFMCHIAAHLAQSGSSIAYHSLEMSEREIYERWSAWFSTVTKRSRRQFIGGLSKARELVEAGRLEVFTRSNSIEAIERDIHACCAKDGFSAAFVDYVQLVRGKSKESREREVADVTRRLKILAGECRIPIIAGAQLNRAAGERPRMCHLRESGAIEQDANIVILLDPQGDWQDTAIPDVRIVVAKNRHGSTGAVDCHWDKSTNRYAYKGANVLT